MCIETQLLNMESFSFVTQTVWAFMNSNQCLDMFDILTQILPVSSIRGTGKMVKHTDKQAPAAKQWDFFMYWKKQHFQCHFATGIAVCQNITGSDANM